MAKTKAQPEKQAVSKRNQGQDGRFLPGNSYGRWKPGESGNVKGRRDALADILRRRLSEIRDKADGRSNAELIADMLLEEAIINRNVQAAKEIFDRTEGKARQAIDVTVRQSETEMYEGMIADLITRAAQKGLKLSRKAAIEYLARHDARILEIIEPESDKVQ